MTPPPPYSYGNEYGETFDAARGTTRVAFNGTTWTCARNDSRLVGYSELELASQEPNAFIPPPGSGVCPPNALCYVDAPWLDPPSQCACSVNYSRVGFGCHGSRPFAQFQAAVAALILAISAVCGFVCFVNLLALALNFNAKDKESPRIATPDNFKPIATRKQRCLSSLSRARTLSIVWGLGWAIGDSIMQALYIAYFVGDGSLAFLSIPGSVTFAVGIAITVVCVSMTFVTIALAWVETADKVARLSPASHTMMARYRVAIALWCVVLIAFVVGLSAVGSNRYVLLGVVVGLGIYTVAYLVAFVRIRTAIGTSISSSNNNSGTPHLETSVLLQRIYRSIAFNALGVAVCSAIAVAFVIAAAIVFTAASPKLSLIHI